jgi:hypothetical protein
MVSRPASQELSGFTVSEIPIRAFFRAINGFGRGEGDPASLERLQELLTSQKIVGVKANAVGQPERVIIREMILENGTRLHFEASARGACIYYIEEPGPSCVEVVENVLDSQSSDPDREEAGRDPEAAPRDVEAAEVSADSSNHPSTEQSSAGGMSGLQPADHVRGSNHPGDGSNDTDPPMRL